MINVNLYYFDPQGAYEEMAVSLRANRHVVHYRWAKVFSDKEVDSCDAVVIMPDVPLELADKIAGHHQRYGVSHIEVATFESDDDAADAQPQSDAVVEESPAVEEKAADESKPQEDKKPKETNKSPKVSKPIEGPDIDYKAELTEAGVKFPAKASKARLKAIYENTVGKAK